MTSMELDRVREPEAGPLRIIDETGLPDVDRQAIERFVREQIVSIREPMPPTVIVMQIPPRDRATFKLLLSWNLLQAALVIGVGAWAYVTLTSFTNAVLNAPANMASSVYQHVPSWLGGPRDTTRQ